MKGRLSTVTRILEKTHWSKTSNANRDNMFYVTKEETRLNGPWSDTDREIVIPPRYRVGPEATIKSWHPWQQEVLGRVKQPEDRVVNVVLDGQGKRGKSTLCLNQHCSHKAIYLKASKDMSLMTRDLASLIVQRGQPETVYVDFPRAIGGLKMREMWQGIEAIKDGYLTDNRYKMTEIILDRSPHIWVFANTIPEVTFLSADRWAFWYVEDFDMSLRSITPDEAVSLGICARATDEQLGG